MASLELDKCFDVALEVAKVAGSIIRTAINKKKEIGTKLSFRDLVTETDTAVEELVIKRLSEAFPSHKFIAEESVSSGTKCILSDDPTWIIDPVDGTMNFVHGFPYTCISIGLWVNKAPEIGIIYNPNLEHMYTARKGRGAFLNGEQINVSGQTELDKALIFTEMGYRDDPKKMDIVLNNIRKIMLNAHGIRSMGSAALNICSVAQGGIDGYYEIGIHAWDLAAGVLMITEAGGYVCDVDGGEFNILGRRILCASSKELAEKLTNILEVYAEERD